MNIGKTQWGVGEKALSNTNTHTHTHSVLRDTQGGLSLGQVSDTILTHAGWPPLIKLIGYEHREDAVGGAGYVKHTHSHTHTVSRVTQGGWSLGQGSDAILAHVGVAPSTN